MSGEAVPSKEPKTFTSIRNGRRTFFLYVIFEVRLSDLPSLFQRREMWSGTFGLFIETTTLTSCQYTKIYCIYDIVYMKCTQYIYE